MRKVRKRSKYAGRRIRRLFWRRLVRWSLWLTVLAAAVWLLGLVRFAGQIPSGIDDPLSRTDAVVVLTGGSNRLQTGLQLLAARRGKKLFVSGVHAGVKVEDLLRLAEAPTADMECCIVLGYSATDTGGNARETAQWMQVEGYTSLRLVTANYHMQRSLLEFRRALPEARIVAHPVPLEHVKRQDWWRFPGTARLVVAEYSKFLVALARSMVPGNVPDRDNE